MSSIASSGALFVLLEDLRVVQLNGIWGPNGTAKPAPGDIIIQPPGLGRERLRRGHLDGRSLS